MKRSLAPHVRTERSVRGMMGDMVLALLLLLIVPTVYYGPRVPVLAIVTVGTCLLCELLFVLVSRVPLRTTDFAGAVTGLLITLLMPPNVDVWIPIAAGIFAILVAKMPFGGTGRSPFNPAAAGFVFAAVCWPDWVFTYADPLRQQAAFPLLADCREAVLGNSPAAMLQNGLRPQGSLTNLLTGRYPGAIGATAAVVILACGIYLIVRRAANWDGAAVYLAVCAVWAAVAPRIVGTRQESVLFELTSGTLLFCAVFMVSEPSTSPRTRTGRYLYGALAALFTMTMRYFGPFEQGGCFALLLVNTLTPALDRAAWKLTHRITLERVRQALRRTNWKGESAHED